MRLLKLILSDIRLQIKSGFYGVYIIFTIVYLFALFLIPENIRETVAAVMIFTDPAAMGLFFMGALVLLEKSQRVNYALAVSPMKTWEYCMAKLISLSIIGLLVAFVLAIVGGISSIIFSLTGVLFASFLFSSCGFIAAEKAKSLNQFILFAVPFELFIFLPPATLLFGVDYPNLILHPGVASVLLISGDAESKLLCLLILIIWSVFAVMLCILTVKRNFLTDKGVKI